MLVSVIVPCFNEEKVLQDTYRRLSAALPDGEDVQHEFVFVDDGSTDNTLAILMHLATSDGRVNIVKLSRNFGHQPAVSAGIRYCHGDLAAIIDADLQDPPEVIPDMVAQLSATGSNVVYGVRTKRKGETLFKRAACSLFYRILSRLSDVPQPVNTGDFRVIDRRIIDLFNQLEERNKYVRGLISWMGFKQTPFYYERDPRYAGIPKYTLKKLFGLASTGIFYFSKKPLQISTGFGFLSVAVGLVLSFWILFNKLLNPTYLISGWTSLILMIIYFGGVQLLTIGILGQYIGSLFDETKKRPEFIVDRTINYASGQVRDAVPQARLSRQRRVPTAFFGTNDPLFPHS
jgi:dolichol-phosphate mannosyltransferase